MLENVPQAVARSDADAVETPVFDQDLASLQRARELAARQRASEFAVEVLAAAFIPRILWFNRKWPDIQVIQLLPCMFGITIYHWYFLRHCTSQSHESEEG